MELKITAAEFDTQVLNSELPVLVDFYADWCGPCKMMAPIIGRIAEDYEGRLTVGKCNIDNEEELAAKYGIMSIPTIMVFKGGEPVLTSVGALSQADLESKINGVI